MHILNISILLTVGLVASIAARPPQVEDGKRLIKTSESEPGVWLSQDEIYSLINAKVGFMDVTDRRFPTMSRDAPAPNAFPTTLRFNSSVQAAFPKVSADRIQDFITEFSSFHNRYYNNTFGVEAASWLRSQINQTIIGNSLYSGNVSVKAFEHTKWLQPSTIARIEGSEPGVVIIGAHMDSLQSGNGANGEAPGSDDNASGSSSVLEAFRAILESNFVPKKSIEFQWYAGEELGLLGSQDIAQNYFENQVEVISMLNFDCVGYKSNLTKLDIRFRTDNGDINLTEFLQLAVEGYLNLGWTTSQCGYACSDHASWDSFAFSAASPAEPISSPYMHSTSDNLATVDFEMVRVYTKLALAYIIELSEPRV